MSGSSAADLEELPAAVRYATEEAGGADLRSMSSPHGDRRPNRGHHRLLVEFVRLIMVALFAGAGWQVALATDPNGPPLLGIVLGSAFGYVAGGVFGRRTSTAVSGLEREFARVPAAEILSGSIGAVVGLVLAALLSIPLFHLPLQAAFPSVAFIYATLGFLSYSLGRSKTDELFALFGMKPRAAGTVAGEVAILDASALLDGRLSSLVQLGFLRGTFLVTRGVLDELQSVADSSDERRRGRGRKALDLVLALKRDPSVDVILVDDEPLLPGEPVDTHLVRLARHRGAALVTNDANLAKVAAALEVPVRSMHALADAMRPVVVPGDRVTLRLSRPGREAGQGVGYLEDGTMVVVEEASDCLGTTVEATVHNALQTSTGQMVFATLSGEPTADEATNGREPAED